MTNVPITVALLIATGSASLVMGEMGETLGWSHTRLLTHMGSMWCAMGALLGLAALLSGMG